MNETIKHYYLYAKGYYAKGPDLLNDLIKIKSSEYIITCSKDAEEVIIQNQLLTEIYRYINSRDQFIKFIDDLCPSSFWRLGAIDLKDLKDKVDMHEVIIRKCLSILKFINIDDIPFDLPLADSNILPLNK